MWDELHGCLVSIFSQMKSPRRGISYSSAGCSREQCAIQDVEPSKLPGVAR